MEVVLSYGTQRSAELISPFWGNFKGQDVSLRYTGFSRHDVTFKTRRGTRINTTVRDN